MVHYCSKACQKGAWKTHKPRCANGSKMREQMVENETFAMITKVLDGWLKYWRNSFHTYGLISMDLANHPDGRLATHW